MGLLEARRPVDKLRAGLDAEGFRYDRLLLAIAGRRRVWRFRPINPDEPQPAHKVKRLTAEERRALRRSRLTEEQIDAVSLVGLGADAVHELMLRGIYWGAYHFNKDWFPNAPQLVKAVMSGVQRAGLWLEKRFDDFQQWSGYPGATENDEAQTVNFFPSLIYPTFDCNGDWHQNKFVYGQTTYGPGRGT